MECIFERALEESRVLILCGVYRSAIKRLPRYYLRFFVFFSFLLSLFATIQKRHC